jgi:hypothetical protein
MRYYAPAMFACVLTLVLSTTSCPQFWCDDCPYPCPEGCTEGDCQEGFYSSLDAPLSSKPVQWLTRLTVGGCRDVFDEENRLVGIECDAERGSIFAEISYDDDGHALAIDVHDYPGQLETASQHFDLLTDEDGRIIESTLVFLDEVSRVETFTWDGDRVASVRANHSRSDFVEDMTFSYDEAGTLRTVDTVPTTSALESDLHQVRYTFDEEQRPLIFTVVDLRSGSTLITERNVYDASGTPPSSYERDDGGDGIDEVITFHYEDGGLVSYDTDRAPIGSIDGTTAVSDNCCGQWCTPR